MSEDGTLSVADLVDYCRTQAGLLSGRTETIGAEADELLDEIDEDIAALRARLAEHGEGTEAPTTPPSAAGSEGDGGEVTELEDLESELEEKQAVARAKQARMQAVQNLAVAYTELAEALESVDDGRKALERVVEFEREHDAPAYFDDRRTVLEAAAESSDAGGE
jgi:hypothetical protein